MRKVSTSASPMLDVFIPATLVMDFTTGVAIFKRFVLCREFQDRQILFGSISFPFYVDFVIETKGVGVMVCSCLSWLEPFFSFRVTSLFIL